HNLCARITRPAGSVAGERLPRPQLAGRQSRWDAGAGPRATAPALWVLRGPHGRHLWCAGLDGWARLLRLSALADSGRHAGVLLCPLYRELPCHLYERTLSSFAWHLWSHRNSHPAGGGQRCAPRPSLRAHRRPELSAVRRCRVGEYCRHGVHGPGYDSPPYRRALSGGNAVLGKSAYWCGWHGGHWRQSARMTWLRLSAIP